MIISKSRLNNIIESLLFENEEGDLNQIPIKNEKIRNMTKKIVDEGLDVVISIEEDTGGVNISFGNNWIHLIKSKVRSGFQEDESSDIIAYGSMSALNVSSRDNMGPILYDIAMEIFPVTPAQIGGLEDSAYALWEKYMQRDDVEKMELDLHYDPRTPSTFDDSISEAYFGRWIKDCLEGNVEVSDEVYESIQYIRNRGHMGIIPKIINAIKDFVLNSNFYKLKKIKPKLSEREIASRIEYKGELKGTIYGTYPNQSDASYYAFIFSWHDALSAFYEHFHNNLNSPFKYVFKKNNQEIIDYLYSQGNLDQKSYDIAMLLKQEIEK